MTKPKERDVTVREGELYEERYRVLRALGGGGFGQTFVAKDERSGEQVVLKTLRLDRAEDWKSVELFEREAKMLEQLDHPGIPAYIDWFEAGEGAWCLVQRMAPGQTLSEKVGAGWAPTEAQAVDLARRVLEILIYLQDRHPPIVHRDIKPENLLIDEDGRVSLVDFGSVKSATKGEKGSTVAGTFGYMAPEQLRGVANERTDLYGLGATLLYAMTGTQPEELPTARLKIDTAQALPRASGWLRAWLDGMIDPIEEERHEDAKAAAQALAAREDSPPTPTPATEPTGDADGASDAPSTPLPKREGRHEALEKLRRKRLGMFLGFLAVLVAGVVTHATGKHVLGDDALWMALGGFLLMPVGAIGATLMGARLKRSVAQDRLERHTGRRLPVLSKAWMSVDARTGEGKVLSVRRRRSVFATLAVVVPTALLVWTSGLVGLARGFDAGLGQFMEILTHPSAIFYMFMFVCVYGLSRMLGAGFEVNEKGAILGSGFPVILPGYLKSWRVTTREVTQGGARRFEVSVWARWRGGEKETPIFTAYEASEGAARAQARLLHELLEKRLRGSGRTQARSEDVALDFSSGEDHVEVEEVEEVARR